MKRGRRWWALALAVSPAFWLAPVEEKIRAERAELKYGGAPVTLAMRDRIGQGMAIGLLAGFRGVVADFLWIQNHVYWENLWRPQTDISLLFVRMYRNMTTVVMLQPRAVFFWHTSAWHMAWNIGYAARISPQNRTQAQRVKRDWEWRLKARDLLQDGLQNNPDSWELHFHMGWLYLRKLDDPCRAAEYFRQAAELPGAPSYTARECAHCLEKCGKPEAAYEYWKKIWNSGDVRDFNDGINMRAVAKREIPRLEELLQIPPAARLFSTGTETP